LCAAKRREEGEIREDEINTISEKNFDRTSGFEEVDKKEMKTTGKG